MPAWWKRRSKSKSKSSSSPRKEAAPAEPAVAAELEEGDGTPKHRGEKKKEKGGSFDQALAAGKSLDPSPLYAVVTGGGGGGQGMGFAFGHPLPLPTSISSPLPTSVVHDHGAVWVSASASASASSVGSSGSDETPDLAFSRYSDPVHMPRSRNIAAEMQRHQHLGEDRQIYSYNPVLEHARSSETTVSPRRDLQVHGFDASSNTGTSCSRGWTSSESVSSKRTTSPSPGSRQQTFTTSPVHPRSFGLSPASPNRRQDNFKSPPHPLPLPPGSPTSPSSSNSSSLRSLKSQWKKGKLIGSGTFGHVYFGFNSESGLMCAIKEVKDIADDTNSKECLRQLNQEISLLSQLSHPNIVQYYGSELTEDTLSIYLEYVSGGSIHKLLQEYGPFGESLIRSYTAQILSGLAYLHGRNTMHRDIKGANILVGSNGEIRLADFGMAKHISSYTSVRSFKGSPYWMAPEVIMNASGYNLSVDIWSLGCTVLEMATSKPPWSQFEGVAAIFKIGNSKDIPEIPDHLSSEGKEFIRLCLQRDPSARPSATQLLDHPFVRDQAAIKSAKHNTVRETLPSMSEGSHKMMQNVTELSSNRNSSPRYGGESGMRKASVFPLASPSSYKNASEFTNTRMNMSLPVSPCSSPLRQFRQSNRSCMPSPPHPAFSAEAANYSPINHALNPTRTGSSLLDPWLDISQVKAKTPQGSPRRMRMGV